MTEGAIDTLDGVIQNLDRLNKLSDSDKAAFAALPLRVADYGANQTLVREGTRPERCCMLLSGYACRHKTTSKGARQIVSFQIPGDLLDIQHLELECADHSVQTITPCTIALVSKDDMRRILDDHPGLRKAVWRSALIDASIFREWVVNVGRREAIARIAHMLCELAARREAAGLGSPDRFELPMTQEQIADATGLTPVHVNRMLQVLGAEGVISRNKRDLTIVDWSRMRQLADFDPAYLHLAS